MNNRIIAVTLLATALLVACGRYFAPDRHVQRILSVADVHGVWSLTDESLSLARRDGYAPTNGLPHQIELLAGGACRYRSLLPSSGYIASTGTWTLVHDRPRGHRNCVDIHLHSEGVIHVTGLCITQQKNRLYLFTSWGDPDEWEFMEYEHGG